MVQFNLDPADIAIEDIVTGHGTTPEIVSQSIHKTLSKAHWPVVDVTNNAELLVTR
jgi:hypothetical protein